MHRKRILIVEGDVVLADLCGLMLDETHRFLPRIIHNGGEAAATARNFEPHLIFLDLDLPDHSASDLLAELHADPVLSNIPVILITGKLNSEEAAEESLWSKHPLLAKPFPPAKLRSFAHACLLPDPGSPTLN
jgi:two-component system OmpR family response regulator